jgi:hypothetical protein
MTKYFNKGIAAMGVIIVLVVAGLIAGGLYFYLHFKTIEGTSQNQNTSVSPENKQANKKISPMDIKRKTDLTLVAIEMDYYNSKGSYPQFKTMPVEIGVIPIPTDPVTHNLYNWLDNTTGSKMGCSGEKYCAWADLEEGGYYVSSEQGSAEISTKPTECPCLTSSTLRERPDWAKIYPGPKDSGTTWAFVLNQIFEGRGIYPTATSTSADKQYFVEKCAYVYGLTDGDVSACYMFIAGVTKDTNICNYVEDYYFGRCIFDIARAENDPSLCAKIPASTNGKNLSMTLDRCTGAFVACANIQNKTQMDNCFIKYPYQDRF